MGERIIRRIPTLKQQSDAEFRRSDKWTREVIRELGRLGYDVASQTEIDGEGRTYLTHVGLRNLSVIVRVILGTDGIPRIKRVIVGRDSMTARQAALWLRKRAPRVRRYL